MLKFSRKYIISVVGVLIIINLVLITVLLSIKINSSGNNLNKIADPNSYQAVFLNNDQIYFGHLKNIGLSEYLLLTDVYYVKVNENSVGQLVKLGQGEPHSPKNEMIINQEHVLFWENLKIDSPIIKTIQNMHLQGR